MSQIPWVAWAIAAVALFWAVGAYNRLVRLRNALTQGFALVNEQFQRRHKLLLALADLLGNGDAAPPFETLRTACAQAASACARAGERPSAAGAITSLRLAEAILADARQRVPGEALAAAPAAELQAELNAADATLAFAREQFNGHVDAYNRAVAQFPTGLLAASAGFRPAGSL